MAMEDSDRVTDIPVGGPLGAMYQESIKYYDYDVILLIMR